MGDFTQGVYMKKLLWVTAILLATGCSSHTEIATESGTAKVQIAKSDSSQWIEQLLNNREILSRLNATTTVSPNIHTSDFCNDSVVQQAFNDPKLPPIIVKIDDDQTHIAIDVLNAISSTGAHFEPQWTEQILKLSAARDQISTNDLFSWTDDDIQKLKINLPKIGFDPDAPNADETFVQLLKGDHCQDILPRYCTFQSSRRVSLEQAAKRDRSLDIMLTCELTRYAGILRLNYPQNNYIFDQFRPFLSDDAIIETRKQVFIHDMAKRGVQAAFNSIQPPHPQYKALIATRKIYLDAIAHGGWPKLVHPTKYTDPVIGKSYPYVPSLRARIIAENYSLTNQTSDIFDQNLADNIALYRELHQLSPKKLIDKVLFRNLDVSPQIRLDTIDLAIQKYRESAIGSLQYYLMVNIPDFYVEVWKDGNLERRHKIVVGNNKLQRDPLTNEVLPDPETLYPWHPNRTPIQTSKINEIILNPYWNVPTRIRIEELEPKLAENPNYYIENNYEEVNVDDPKLYYVRELPNPKNSLGKVKFMFPNPHNTYLHDTPAKNVFKNPVRAYSHGCMRTQDPLELAKYLLINDGQWDEKKYDQILHADPLEQVSIMLNHPVDIDVVYIDARVDKSGHVAFLSDIYDYDAVRTGKIVLKKLPKPKDWK